MLLAALLAGTSASAHEDAVFPIAPSGFLQAFPDAYGPASIQLGAPSPERPSIPGSAVVRIGSSEVRLPQCIRSLLAVPPSEEIQAHGSWYHDLSRLPPYVVVDFPQRREPGGFEGHALTFDMSNGELREVHRWQLREGVGRRTPVDPAQSCSAAELEALAPRPTTAPAPPGAIDTGHGKTLADCLLLGAAEAEEACLRERLDAADWRFAVETGWFASCMEVTEPTDVLEGLKRFRRHFCSEHLQHRGEAPGEIEGLRCRLEITEASLHQASEFAAKVCQRDR